ncbi:MAG: hypothetical protein KKI06_12375 [Euryarchaeota archaeon]|nr:hypothetical protein [Euryarchaeota archaeon]
MLKRREFLRRLAILFSIIMSGCLDKSKEEIQEVPEVKPLNKNIRSQVYVIKTDDRALGVRELMKYYGAGDLSGKKVLEETGVMELAEIKGFDVVVLDDQKKGWSRVTPQGSHWKNGFLFPDVFSKADDSRNIRNYGRGLKRRDFRAGADSKSCRTGSGCRIFR